jgi:hypothetical protein
VREKQCFYGWLILADTNKQTDWLKASPPDGSYGCQI